MTDEIEKFQACDQNDGRFACDLDMGHSGPHQSDVAMWREELDFDVVDVLVELANRAGRMSTVIHNVQALHYRVEYTTHVNGDTPGCSQCGRGWPCATQRMLAGVVDV